jgi:hypothetical protein
MQVRGEIMGPETYKISVSSYYDRSPAGACLQVCGACFCATGLVLATLWYHRNRRVRRGRLALIIGSQWVQIPRHGDPITPSPGAHHRNCRVWRGRCGAI